MANAQRTSEQLEEMFTVETRELPWIGGIKAFTADKSWWATYDFLIAEDEWSPDLLFGLALQRQSEVGGTLAKNYYQVIPQTFEAIRPKMQALVQTMRYRLALAGDRLRSDFFTASRRPTVVLH